MPLLALGLGIFRISIVNGRFNFGGNFDEQNCLLANRFSKLNRVVKIWKTGKRIHQAPTVSSILELSELVSCYDLNFVKDDSWINLQEEIWVDITTSKPRSDKRLSRTSRLLRFTVD